jgi:uncharacterized protein Yka (UPF0111/DUF47 family)
MLTAIKNFLRPKQQIFYDLLIEQADYAVEATGMILQFLNDPSKQQKKTTQQIEKQADDARRQLIGELNRTFVTPFDREDINALSRDLDDVVDYAYTTTEELLLFKLKKNNHLFDLATLVQEGAVELQVAISHLQKEPQVAIIHAQRAKKVETKVEITYRKALAELFTPPEDFVGMVEILKRREVYRHLSNAADRVDEAANILSDIIMKTS